MLIPSNHSPSCWFSAELILHENIEYNDLVDSIQDENLASDDTKDDKQASKNECVEPKNGKYVLFHGFNFLPYGAWWVERKESEWISEYHVEIRLNNFYLIFDFMKEK